MERLINRDLGALFQFLGVSYASTSVDALLAHALSTLGKLIPADRFSYNEIDLNRKSVVWRECPDGAGTFPGSAAILGAHIREHPLVTHYVKTGDRRPRKLSDFVTRHELHRSVLYNEYYRRVSTEHQIAFALPSSRTRVIALGMTRQRRDFSERDRRVLELLRPGFSQAYRNAQVFSSLLQTLDGADRGIVMLNRDGKLLFCSRRAEAWLQAYFGRRARQGLPAEVHTWVQRCLRDLRRERALTALHPLVIERPETRLIARLAFDGFTFTVLFEERWTALTPDRVQDRLALSRRQADVLVWVASGKTNEDIARILGLSARTIAKHLEHIFQRLGVETRTAAAARALSPASTT